MHCSRCSCDRTVSAVQVFAPLQYNIMHVVGHADVTPPFAGCAALRYLAKLCSVKQSLEGKFFRFKVHAQFLLIVCSLCMKSYAGT